jgi:uncharacterized protein (DUF488 family)
MSEKRPLVFTIGHSTHPTEAFLALLQQYGVTAVADVRSVPFSRYNPQFSRESLERTLQAHEIKYVFLGHALGARSDDHSCYVNGRVQYARLARTELFQGGIDRIVRGAQEHRVALMCAEKEPLECHRALLVARTLDERGTNVGHILADGKLESHSDAMERLLELAGLPNSDLFRSRESLIAQALARQEEKVAYVDEKLASNISDNA